MLTKKVSPINATSISQSSYSDSQKSVGYYKIYVEKAALEHKEITESFEEEAQQYSKIALVLESATNPLSKIREIQNTTKKQLDFKELESLNISKLEVSLQEDYLNSLIKSNIKV